MATGRAVHHAGIPAVETIAELEPGATIVNDGLAISRNSVADAEASVADWVRGLGLGK